MKNNTNQISFYASTVIDGESAGLCSRSVVKVAAISAIASFVTVLGFRKKVNKHQY